MHEEDLIDDIIGKLANEDISAKEKKTAIDTLLQLKLDDISDIVRILSTLYDKQALACRESTAIIDGNISISRFEDL